MCRRSSYALLISSLILPLLALGCGESPAPKAVIIVQGCGDAVCEDGEDATSCPQDCASLGCGDGVCQRSEDANTCPQDCPRAPAPRCGDGVCDSGQENANTCPQDCASCQVACQGDALLYCGEQGQQERLACSALAGASCQVRGDEISCDCGSLAEGQGRCAERAQRGADLAICEGGALSLYRCPLGTQCQDGGCVCDSVEDGVCPDPVCTQDPDCKTCTPACEGRVCGDNQCEGSCGTCAAGSRCDDANGQCVPVCAPQCHDRACGDDGCGGVCGTCPQGQSCDADGQCQAPPALNSASFKSSVQGGSSASYSFDEREANTSFICSVNTATNFMAVELSNGVGLVRMYMYADPITFCLFNTGNFNNFTYQRLNQGQLLKSYGIDTLGHSTGLRLACRIRNGRLTGTFSAERLFESANSGAFPRYASITDGSFDCALP